jgi:hypothetical protein
MMFGAKTVANRIKISSTPEIDQICSKLIFTSKVNQAQISAFSWHFCV